MLHFTASPPSPFVGTARTVAATLEEWLVEGGLDGVILLQNLPSDFHRFADEVIPLLQDRGVFRRDYESSTLRGNLGLDVPANRHAQAVRAGAGALG